MPRPHLKVREFDTEVVLAADELIEAKPWRLDDTAAQVELGNKFLARVCESYGAFVPEIVIDPTLPGLGAYDPITASIDGNGVIDSLASAQLVLKHWSITTLFCLAGHHLAISGVEIDAEPQEWGLSLFYTVRPVMFRARAREGRIVGVTAKDTYSSVSWERLRAAGMTYRSNLSVPRGVAARLLDGTDDGSDHQGTEAAPVSDDGLDSLNRDHIRLLATQHNIAGRGSMNKSELVAALREAGVRG